MREFKENSPNQELESESSDKPRIHMLLVDERSVSSLLEYEAYRAVGISVFLASNLNEIKSALRRHNIDVALINWENSHLNPVESIDIIRSHSKTKNIPILVTSIHGADDKIATNPQIDLFVRQPIPKVILLERIRQLLNKKMREGDRVDTQDLFLEPVNIRAHDGNYTLKLVDLSLSGVFLYSENIFVKGESIELEFCLPGIKGSIRVDGEVIRVVRMNKINDKMNKGIAVRFTKFYSGAKENLEQFVEQNKPENSFISYYL